MEIRDQAATASQMDELTVRLETDLETVFRFIHGEILACVTEDPEETLRRVQGLFENGVGGLDMETPPVLQ